MQGSYLFRERSNFHICGMTQSWPGQWGRRLPEPHHHGGYRYQCRAPEGGTWCDDKATIWGRGEFPIFSSPIQAWEIFKVCFWPSHLKPHPTKFPPESLGLHPQARDRDGKGQRGLTSEQSAGTNCGAEEAPWEKHHRLEKHLLEQLQDANHNVIDVAEARGLWEMDL